MLFNPRIFVDSYFLEDAGNGHCAAFPGNSEAHPSSLQQSSGVSGRGAASIGSVLANIENDIAKLLKIKSGNQ